jgi:hypothetical protein
MSDASKIFEVTFSVRAASRKAAERVVAAAIDAALEPEKDGIMSDTATNGKKGDPGVPAPHEIVNANRGVRLPDPKRDERGKLA